MHERKPAVLGGEPSFKTILPITRPTIPRLDELENDLRECFCSGMITDSKNVRKFEEAVARYLGVRYAVALSCCTDGLMLTLKALDLEGEVIAPSFTFSATGHAIVWAGLKIRFVDINPKTFNLDPEKVEEAITGQTSAIMAVHIFGNPCEADRLEEIARKHGLKLIFDSAHALGSLYNGRKIGSFGDAEVFSLSPTKLVVAAEGGIVATNNEELARRVKIGKNYGNPGDYNCEFPGLSARMPEFNAILGLKTLEKLEENIAKRHEIAKAYKEGLSDLPGISFQEITPGGRTTYKDFAILVDPEEFGLDRDDLCKALEAENIMTRRYFFPPLHKQKAYQNKSSTYDDLPNTDFVSKRVLCLPIFSHMPLKVAEQVVAAIRAIHKYAPRVRKALTGSG